MSVLRGANSPYWHQQRPPIPQILSQLQPVQDCLTNAMIFNSSSTPGALASPSGSSCSSSGDSANDSNMSVGSVSPIRANTFHDVGGGGSFGNVVVKPVPDHHQVNWYGGILDDIEAVLKQDENFDMIVMPQQQQQQ